MPVPSNPAGGMLKVDLFLRGDAITLALAGELDLASVDAVREKLAEARGLGSRIVVDLRELTFIDSTGISLLLSAVKEDREGRLSFIPCGAASVRRVFTVTGVAEVFGGEGVATNGARL